MTEKVGDQIVDNNSDFHGEADSNYDKQLAKES